MHSITFTVTPLEIVPYMESLMYERPIGDNGEAHASISAGSSITIMNFETTHVENMKVCGASFVDAIMDGDSLMPACEYS